MHTAAKVRIEKDKHPERFCAVPSCLWRIVTPRGANPCQKHPVAPVLSCDRCGKPVEDVTNVVTEAWYRGDRDQPAYPATVEGWCQSCVDDGGFLAVANDDYQRERGDDDGVEYGDPRDVY